jgi:hypothetical protein
VSFETRVWGLILLVVVMVVLCYLALTEKK